MATDLAFLGSEVDEGFDPSGKLKPENLVDGEYDMKVTAANGKVVSGKNPAFVIEMTLEVLSAGKHQGDKIEFSWWVKDKKSADRVGESLAKLGFDTAEWKIANNRPFTVEIQKASKVLVGMIIKAKKGTSEGKDDKGNPKTWHNLYLNKRSGTDGKPERIGPAELDATDPDDPFT